MTRAALELVGQAVLGRCFDPLTEKGQHPYTEALKCYMYVHYTRQARNDVV